MSSALHFLSRLVKKKWIEIFLGLLCVPLILLLIVYKIPFISSFIKQMDGRIYDQMVNLNWHTPSQTPPVILINIDESSVQKEGRWPWPRDKMAKLINQLKQYGVVAMGLDIVMSEAEVNYAIGMKQKLLQLTPEHPENNKSLIDSLDKLAPQMDNDKEFAQSLLDHNVVLGFLFHNDDYVRKGALPTPLNSAEYNSNDLGKIALYQFLGYNGALPLFMDASTKAGFVTNIPDADGTVRHSLLLATYRGNLYPSLALATAMNYLLLDNVRLKIKDNTLLGFDLGGTFIPTGNHGQILIPFWGPASTLSYYSAADILEHKIDPKELQGTIAVVGSTMTLLADIHASPVSSLFPGLEMVGNIVQALVNQELIAEFEWLSPKGLFILCLLGMLFAFLLPFLGITLRLLVSLITLTVLLGTAFYLFRYAHWYIPTAFLILLILLQSLVNYGYAYVTERLQKQKISQLFGQYVPQAYVKELIDTPEHYTMEGRTLDMTVLFIDIRNFTTLSEGLEAGEVKLLLNTFFTPITEIIFSHRGTIDKYVGDMVVAFWGAPIGDKEHTFNAITAALDVMSHLGEINTQMMEQQLPSVSIGIGLSSGPMNVGDMGSKFRRAYTVLGDTVNLGSRLQDLTKFYGVSILASSQTQANQEDFIWRNIDRVTVKGRKTASTIYQPICTKEAATPELLHELEQYHEALNDYYSKNWSKAQQKFETLKSTHPEIYIYAMYLERINSFLKNPPPEDWQGVFVQEHK